MINLEKEIREQPSVLAEIGKKNDAVLESIVSAAKAAGVKNIYFAARGTSDHACIYAQYIFGILCGIPCTLGTPSVFTKYGAHVDLSGNLVIGVSQSGKAEDVIEVIKSAKADGAITVALTNAEGSPLSQCAEYHLFCGAGDEVSIAATKTFTSQMYLLAALASKWCGCEKFAAELANLHNCADKFLAEMPDTIEALAEKYQNITGATILGRGVSYPIALEGALKMLETNKLKMKGYPISDFHHGPIAQIHDGDLVFVLAPNGKVIDDCAEIIRKLHGVSADIVVLTDDASVKFDGCTNVVLPNTGSELTSVFMQVMFFQLLACKMTIVRGIDPDVAGVINKVTITK